MPPNSPKKLLDDCFLHDSERLRHDEALSILKARLLPVVGSETIALGDAAFRILAEDIAAPRDIPTHRNSAVDGYAYASADMGGETTHFPVALRIAAGDRDVPPLARGSAARIFTGAPMPRGADTVAMQEDCRLHETGDVSEVTIPAGLKPGANMRRAGEDVAAGGTIAMTGDRLRPQEIAAIASAGFAEIGVYKRPKIGLVSSGNEIRRPGESLAPGEVFDANHFLLRSLLAPLGAEMVDFGVLADDATATRHVMAEAARSCDAVVTTGGASRGEEDHLIATLEAIGKRHLWQLAVKPGRPMSFGQIADTAVFGLPGNPVAAFVCFLFYVRPALMRLSGSHWTEPLRFPVTAGFSVPNKKAGRREFWRAWLEIDAEGRPLARKFERDGSGLITGLRQATGFVEVGEDITSVEPGETVAFIPFSEFGIA